MFSEQSAFITLMVMVASSSAGLALFIANQFKVHRHDFYGRLKHRDRRLLRIEQFLHDKLGFDLASDLPILDGDDNGKKNR